MKISLVQTNPQHDRGENLRITRSIMEKAVELDKPDLLVLPELFEMYGVSSTIKRAHAEYPGGSAYRMAQSFALQHKVFVHAGSISEKIPSEDRVYNTSFVFDRSGIEIASYRKMHMFDITTSDGEVYNESDTVKPGEAIATYDIEGFKVGCAICYDIRFSELFLALARAGCDIIVLPAAFVLNTGKDHWEVLARSRAIETQTYFVACGQTGSTIVNGEKQTCYGHSLVCDPWGHTIAKASDGVGYVTSRVDREQIERVRNLIPMSRHRRLIS